MRGLRELARHGAADDVDLVEPGAGDEHVGRGRLPARVSASRLVPVPSTNCTSSGSNRSAICGAVIDDEDFVLSGQPLGQGKPDFASANDDDAHPLIMRSGLLVRPCVTQGQWRTRAPRPEES